MLHLSDNLAFTFYDMEMLGTKCFIPQSRVGNPGAVLPYMGHIGMCRCKEYGFQAVYSSIGYINQSVWV